MKVRLFIHAVHMEWLRCMLIGLQLTIGNLMDYLLVMEFFLTTKVLGEEKLLLRGKSQEVSQEFNLD